jgi:trk system potassium uptake protein TrkA
MKIVISGGTELGVLLAKNLAADNDLIVIESSEKAVKHLEQLDLQIINGDSASIKVLQEAQIETADVFIACNQSDDANVISCLAVKQISGAKTFCFVNKLHYFHTFAGELGEKLVVDKLIWPEMYLGNSLAQILAVPGAIDVKFFENEDLKLLEFMVQTEGQGANKLLKDLNTPKGALVVAVIRADSVIIPSGLTRLQKEDKIVFVGHESPMRKIENRFKPNRDKILEVIIVGGGTVGYILGKALEPFGNIRVKIVEKNQARCEELSEMLSDKVVVLNADGAEMEFLKTLNLDHCDCLVALTGNDQRNYFVAMNGKFLKAKKTIARVHNADNVGFFEDSGIDLALSSQLNAIQTVLRQISTDSLDVFAIIEKGKAEIREVLVPKTFVAARLMDIKLPEGIIIAAIRRGGRTIVPSGQDKIKGGDNLRVFCATEKSKVIAEFLNQATESK